MLDYHDLESQLIELLDASHWYVGFSGGVDSTVLLHLLARWRDARSQVPALGAIHVNHGLQPEADDWQAHCESTCRALGLECLSLRADVAAAGTGEQAARDARYDAFNRQLQPGTVLFLAHHLDDQVETLFLRLLRGAGVEGLAAMPRRRAIGQGELVRPLLGHSRAAVEAYAAHHKLDFVEDPSNRDTDFDRNFLRREVLPLLESRWPAYRESVSRASGHLASAARLLEDVPETVQSVMGDPGVALDALVAVPGDVAANRLRGWLRGRACRVPDRVSLLEFLRQLRESGDAASPRLDCGQYVLQCFRDAVYLLPDFTAGPPTETLDLGPGDSLHVPGVGSLRLVLARKDGFRLETGEQVEVRWRRGGERCRPRGRGGSVSLKGLLQETGVPPWWRERVPLVFLGDELLAVGDFTACESSRCVAAGKGGERGWQLAWERPASAGSD